MTRKNLARLIGAALALAGSNAVMACSTAAWTTTGSGGADVGLVVGSPLAAQPDSASPAARYSGKCGLKATAANNFVRDASPNGESTYRARFYVYTGVTGGEAIVFRAQNAALTDRMRVGVTATNINIYADTDNVPEAAVPTIANRWYSVELTHTGSGSPSINYTVQGASGAGANAATPVSNTFGVSAGVIDRAELGWITSNGAAVGQVQVDAFESRRTTAIGRLCRGDANSDGIYGVQDRIAMTNEILKLSGSTSVSSVVASGQPDCDENGLVSVTDRICVTNMILAAKTCSGT